MKQSLNWHELPPGYNQREARFTTWIGIIIFLSAGAVSFFLGYVTGAIMNVFTL